ncbi:MAG: hypothetical protein MK289_11880 [Trichodesmium sp. ALOHA_ZT_67]|nr:hypothetical protein [Trichodesmium sp. ALOHA_ZT_67]MDE5093007.1 hypothetical protein [Trichodesmium sp. St11_bin5]MDT9342197.1 hypothetical protein [Trichodesmium erythraeum 21-75]
MSKHSSLSLFSPNFEQRNWGQADRDAPSTLQQQILFKQRRLFLKQ